MNKSIMISISSRVQGLTRAWLPGLVAAFFGLSALGLWGDRC
ncbi:MAG: hypothetical protein WCJ99_18910 [Betaproteobacteria bacterium]